MVLSFWQTIEAFLANLTMLLLIWYFFNNFFSLRKINYVFIRFPPAPSSGGTASSSGLNILWQIGPIVLLIGVFYFLVIRPQSKKQKETKKMLESLKKGDKVITIGGIHGTVSSVKENSVIVKVDDDCKLEFLRSAVSTVVSREDSSSDGATEPEKK
jgi:preprotein translocase subunit YajC